MHGEIGKLLLPRGSIYIGEAHPKGGGRKSIRGCSIHLENFWRKGELGGPAPPALVNHQIMLAGRPPNLRSSISISNPYLVRAK
jgi:hypothetical protein